MLRASVLRGGAFNNNRRNVRCAYRNNNHPDNRNNTEGVFISPPVAGQYTIRVEATSINSDAIPGEGDGTDQDFAVVCYNCAEEPGFLVSAKPPEVDICAPEDSHANNDGCVNPPLPLRTACSARHSARIARADVIR